MEEIIMETDNSQKKRKNDFPIDADNKKLKPDPSDPIENVKLILNTTNRFAPQPTNQIQYDWIYDRWESEDKQGTDSKMDSEMNLSKTDPSEVMDFTIEYTESKSPNQTINKTPGEFHVRDYLDDSGGTYVDLKAANSKPFNFFYYH